MSSPRQDFIEATKKVLEACTCQSEAFLEQTDGHARWCHRPFCPCYMLIRGDNDIPDGFSVEPCEWPVHAAVLAQVEAFADAECDALMNHSGVNWRNDHASCRAALRKDCGL